MKHEKLATACAAVLAAAMLVAPTAHAKKKKAVAPVLSAAPAQPIAASGPSPNSQAGGLPATNERVTALVAAVAVLAQT